MERLAERRVGCVVGRIDLSATYGGPFALDTVVLDEGLKGLYAG